MSRRTPIRRRLPAIEHVWRDCPRCGVSMLVHLDGHWHPHNVGDLPGWMANPVCTYSGVKVQRRPPKRAQWWTKFRKN